MRSLDPLILDVFVSVMFDGQHHLVVHLLSEARRKTNEKCLTMNSLSVKEVEGLVLDPGH